MVTPTAVCRPSVVDARVGLADHLRQRQRHRVTLPQQRAADVYRVQQIVVLVALKRMTGELTRLIESLQHGRQQSQAMSPLSRAGLRYLFRRLRLRTGRLREVLETYVILHRRLPRPYRYFAPLVTAAFLRNAPPDFQSMDPLS